MATKALLGEELEKETCEEHFEWFYYYIDLSNEQVFLRQQGRVGTEMWDNWLEGIESNLTRPAFERAWDEIKEEAEESFEELRRVGDSGFDTDPADWPN